MMDRLARLADRRARRVLALAGLFFVVAGALGAGVADRLDPYGAEDPDTESVIADNRLEQAGFRDTGVVVLVRGVDVRTEAGRTRVERLAARLKRDRAVASVADFPSTGSRDYVSKDGRGLVYTSPSPPDASESRKPGSA
jgi:putative drug exporter of the RND superfamily